MTAAFIGWPPPCRLSSDGSGVASKSAPAQIRVEGGCGNLLNLHQEEGAAGRHRHAAPKSAPPRRRRLRNGAWARLLARVPNARADRACPWQRWRSRSRSPAERQRRGGWGRGQFCRCGQAAEGPGRASSVDESPPVALAARPPREFRALTGWPHQQRASMSQRPSRWVSVTIWSGVSRTVVVGRSSA
jgi:hypothetical protein